MRPSKAQDFASNPAKQQLNLSKMLVRSCPMSKVSIGDEGYETADLLSYQQFNLWLI